MVVEGRVRGTVEGEFIVERSRSASAPLWEGSGEAQELWYLNGKTGMERPAQDLLHRNSKASTFPAHARRDDGRG